MTITTMNKQRESHSQCQGFENGVNTTWIAGMENRGSVPLVPMKRCVVKCLFASDDTLARVDIVT